MSQPITNFSLLPLELHTNIISFVSQGEWRNLTRINRLFLEVIVQHFEALVLMAFDHKRLAEREILCMDVPLFYRLPQEHSLMHFIREHRPTREAIEDESIVESVRKENPLSPQAEIQRLFREKKERIFYITCSEGLGITQDSLHYLDLARLPSAENIEDKNRTIRKHFAEGIVPGIGLRAAKDCEKFSLDDFCLYPSQHQQDIAAVWNLGQRLKLVEVEIVLPCAKQIIFPFSMPCLQKLLVKGDAFTQVVLPQEMPRLHRLVLFCDNLTTLTIPAELKWLEEVEMYCRSVNQFSISPNLWRQLTFFHINKFHHKACRDLDPYLHEWSTTMLNTCSIAEILRISKKNPPNFYLAKLRTWMNRNPLTVGILGSALGGMCLALSLAKKH